MVLALRCIPKLEALGQTKYFSWMVEVYAQSCALQVAEKANAFGTHHTMGRFPLTYLTLRVGLTVQVRNAMDRARMNSAIRVFNDAIISDKDAGMVSERVSAMDVLHPFCLLYCVTKKEPGRDRRHARHHMSSHHTASLAKVLVFVETARRRDVFLFYKF